MFLANIKHVPSLHLPSSKNPLKLSLNFSDRRSWRISWLSKVFSWNSKSSRSTAAPGGSAPGRRFLNQFCQTRNFYERLRDIILKSCSCFKITNKFICRITISIIVLVPSSRIRSNWPNFEAIIVIFDTKHMPNSCVFTVQESMSKDLFWSSKLQGEKCSDWRPDFMPKIFAPKIISPWLKAQ